MNRTIHPYLYTVVSTGKNPANPPEDIAKIQTQAKLPAIVTLKHNSLENDLYIPLMNSFQALTIQVLPIFWRTFSCVCKSG